MPEITAFAPCRISFAGGGTDLPAFTRHYTGAVLSAAVSLGATASVRRRPDGSVSLTLDDYGVREHFPCPAAMPAAASGPTSLVSALVKTILPEGGVEVRVRSGIPAGSGLGTSGAVGVATAFALLRLRGVDTEPLAVAEEASRVEIDVLGRPIGRQDQYAAACGGINVFRFSGEKVERHPVQLPPLIKREFLNYFMLFFSGKRRDSSSVLSSQRSRVAAADADTLAALHRMKDIALEMEGAVRSAAWEHFGGLMRQAWEAKVQAAPETVNADTAQTFREALERGAWAMKVTGAGAGGFYLCMAPPDLHPELASYFSSRNLTPYSFCWDEAGVREVIED